MSTHYNTRIVTDGLVLCLDAANPKSYPGTGNTWYDLSGHGNNCVWVSPPSHDGESFALSAHRGDIALDSSMDFSEEQTILMVMNAPTPITRTNPWNQAYGGYGTWTHEVSGIIAYYYGDHGGNNVPYRAQGSNAVPANEWTFMTHTRDIDSVYWYMNADMDAQGSHTYGTIPPASNGIVIGTGYTTYWVGSLSFVAAYTKALTQVEVEQNFAALRGRYGI